MKRLNRRACGCSLLAIAMFGPTAPAFAQAADPPATETPPAASEAPPTSGDATTTDAQTPAATDAPNQQGGRTYAADFFTRFAPRNALDMLNNVPGFAID